MKFTPVPAKKPELKMTPMIDVIFLLLIFFVCTANFQKLEKVLPTVTKAVGSSSATIVIPTPDKLDSARIELSYNGSPRWVIEGNHCRSLFDVRELLCRLREVRADLPVIISSEKNVPVEHVIDVYDACRWAGLSKIQFAARK